MARNRIRGITVEIGGDTTKLDKALQGTDKEISTIARNLKDVEERLKLDPKNVELLDQKQRLLAQQTEKLAEKQKYLQDVLNKSTKSNVVYEKWEKAQASFQTQITKTANEIGKLETEAKRLEDLGFAPDSAPMVEVQQKTEAAQRKFVELNEAMTKTFDDLGRPVNISQYDGLVRELSEISVRFEASRSEGERFDKQIEDAGGTVADLAASLDGASGDIDDAADALYEASDSAGGAGKALSTLGDIAKHAAGELLADAVEKVLSSLKDLGSYIWDLDEATEEYRIAQGKLNTAFEAAGFGSDAAAKAYSEFYKILGDTDTATEASQLLATLAEDEADLANWTKIAAGVAGTFGDALPIEGLIEAANETAKTGKVTGVLADALNWAGVSEDLFNKGLEFLDTEAQRNYRIMQTLTGIYDEAADAFYRNNEAVIESRENQIRLDEALASMGETVSKIKNTFLAELTPALSKVSEEFSTLSEAADWDSLAQEIGHFISNIDFSAVFETIENVISSLLKLGEAAGPSIGVIISLVSRLLDWVTNLSPEAKMTTAALLGMVVGLRGTLSAVSQIGEAVSGVGKISSLFASGPGESMYATFVKWSVIIIAVVAAITLLIAMINVLIGKGDAMNSAMGSIGGAAGNITGGVSGGMKPYSTRQAAILDEYPHFASGGVFAPNSPMLGVLGDNKSEREVAAPESVIEDSVLNAMSKAGLGGVQGVKVNIEYTGNLAQLGRVLQPVITAETARLGPSLT